MVDLNKVRYFTSTGFGCIHQKFILNNKLHIENSVIPSAINNNELMSFSYAFLNNELIGWCCFQYLNNKFILMNQYDKSELGFSELEFLEQIKNNPILQLQQQPYFLGTLSIYVKPEYRNTWLANKLISRNKINILPYLNKYMEIKRKNYDYKFYIDVEPHILKFVKRYFKEICEIIARR